MNNIQWSPYIPIYPNNQIPETKYSSRRVVEPSTRSDVRMTPKEEWPERAEKLRETYRNMSVTTYGPDGNKRKTIIEAGQLFSFYV